MVFRVVADVVELHPAARLSVLVIDDDHDLLEFLGDFLWCEGFDATLLDDPTVALDRLLGAAFDLVMLDLMMPKLAGLDLLSQIREIDDDLAVVMMASAPSLESASASIQLGVSGYVALPVGAIGLRTELARITHQRRFALRRENRLHAAIGRQIRELRAARGLTLEALAEQAGLAAQRLAQLECAPVTSSLEPSASLANLREIAAALDVPLTELLAGASM
jgi:DNA-binding NtrC family response regulator